ncbi:hypothetical protein ACFPQ6_00405, partial [Deinococcus petrolearius]
RFMRRGTIVVFGGLLRELDLAYWQGPALLEAILREEIEARGWGWTQGRDVGGRAYASVMPTAQHRPPVYADSPAHALGLAVLAALASAPAGEGEGAG